MLFLLKLSLFTCPFHIWFSLKTSFKPLSIFTLRSSQVWLSRSRFPSIFCSDFFRLSTLPAKSALVLRKFFRTRSNSEITARGATWNFAFFLEYNKKFYYSINLTLFNHYIQMQFLKYLESPFSSKWWFKGVRTKQGNTIEQNLGLNKRSDYWTIRFGIF